MKRIIFICGVVLTLILASCSTDGDPCAHDWSAWAVTVEPGHCVGATHSDDGEAARACAICGETEKRTICGGTEGLAITDGEVTGIDTAGAVTHLCIPDFDPDTGEPVTSIGVNAFSPGYVGDPLLTSVRLGANVEIIDDYAFFKCKDLATVTFVAGSKLETIGGNAFTETGLTSIEIPASVTEIGGGAFASCDDLTTITFASGSVLEIIGVNTFYESGLTIIEIPAGVTEIDKETFYGCENLVTVTFAPGSKLKTIGESAFNTTDLNGIEIPAGVTEIGIAAFYWSALTSITIPAGVTEIGWIAFADCEDLAIVTVLATAPPELGTDVFKNNHATLQIYVPEDSVTAYKAATNWDAYASIIQAIP